MYRDLVHSPNAEHDAAVAAQYVVARQDLALDGRRTRRLSDASDLRALVAGMLAGVQDRNRLELGKTMPPNAMKSSFVAPNA